MNGFNFSIGLNVVLFMIIIVIFARCCLGKSKSAPTLFDLENIVGTNFLKWTNRLEVRELEEMMALFHPNAIFLPTFSNQLVYDSAGIRKYFAHFMEQNPTCTLTQGQYRSIGYDVYVHMGLYDFHVTKGGISETINARFAFLWVKLNGEWKILAFHSSVLPD